MVEANENNLEIDEETVNMVYKILAITLSKESKELLNGYSSSSEDFEALGRALFNEKVIEIIKMGLESDG